MSLETFPSCDEAALERILSVTQKFSLFDDAEYTELSGYLSPNIVYKLETPSKIYVAKTPSSIAPAPPWQVGDAESFYLYQDSVKDLSRVTGLALPQIVEYTPADYSKPPVLITEWVEGSPMNPLELAAQSGSSKCAIGDKIGSFVFHFNRLVDLDQSDYALYPPRESRLLQFRAFRILKLDQLPNDEKFDALFGAFQDVVHEHEDRKEAGNIDDVGIFAGHSDLRPANLTFHKTETDCSLAGVIDLGSTNRSTPAFELRHFAYVDDILLDAAIESFAELSGVKPDKSLVYFWAKMHAILVGVNLAIGQCPMFLEQIQFLERQYPVYDWEPLKTCTVSQNYAY